MIAHEVRGGAVVRLVTERLAEVYGLKSRDVHADHNDPPADTTDYDGRALVFSVEWEGVWIRVMVEDVTPDSER